MYLSQFSLTPSIFLFSFTCSHSRSSLRLHCPHSHLLGLLLFSWPQMPKWPFPFISFTFSVLFFPSTLFTSNHNKWKQLNFDFASTKISFCSSHWLNGLCLFLFFFLQRVQHTLAHFSLERSQTSHKSWSDMLIKWALEKATGWTHGAVHPTK